MRRGLAIVCLLLVACNALFDIEEGTYVPVAAAEAGSGAPDAAPHEAGSTGDDDDTAVPDSGPCENLQENPAHCGRCNHDCGGGLCGAGQCQEFVVTTERGGDTLGEMVVGANDLTWLNVTRGEIRRAPRRGGGAPTLFYAAPSGSTLGPSLKARDGYLYFTESAPGPLGRVARCKESGCTTAETVLGDIAIPNAIALTKDTLVAIDNGSTNRILRCHSVPCEKPPEVIASGEDLPVRIDARGEIVAWTTLKNGSAMRLVSGAEAPRYLFSGQSLLIVELTDSDALLAELGKNIRSVPLGGGLGRTVAGAHQSDNLIVDDGTLFFNDNDVGSIESVALSGDASATVLAAQQGTTSSLALDARGIFWRNGDGTLHGLAR